MRPTPILTLKEVEGAARTDYRKPSEESKGAQGEAVPSTLSVERICKSVYKQIHTHRNCLSMFRRFRRVTFLCEQIPSVGRRTATVCPDGYMDKMMFTQLQRNHAKIFLPNN